MDINSIELRLEFAGPTQLKDYSTLVADVLGGQEEREEPESIIVRRAKEKVAISWNYDSCGLVKEDAEDSEECIKTFMDILESINAVAPIGILSERVLRADWVFPVDPKCKFRDLEARYRELFVENTALFEGAFDSSLVIDMKRGKRLLHHESGAMAIAQLREDWRVFATARGHPVLFLFLNTFVTDTQSAEYTRESLASFALGAFQLCESHAKAFEKATEGIR